MASAQIVGRAFSRGWAWITYATVGLVWMGLHAADALGPLTDATFVVIGLLALAAGLLGMRMHAVQSRLPWRLMLVAMLVWIVGGGIRQSLGTLGDLSPDRPLLPDWFSLAGYVLMGSGLMILHHRRYRDRTRDLDAFLDAIIAALAVAAVLWVTVISAAIDADTTPVVELLLVTYPVLTLAMAILALRFGFERDGHRVIAHHMLIGALAFLLAGDVIYMLVELDLATIPQQLIDLPYGLAFVLVGASMLHPSVNEMSKVTSPRDVASQRIRLLAVGLALGVPAAITALGRDLTAQDRVVLTTLAVVLTVSATWRVVRAMQAQQAVQRELEHAAAHDALTDLPNRTHLAEHLRSRKVGDDGRYVGALFVDLDRFKLINDGMGHATGDALLQGVARRLRENIGPEDFVARVGGDEFVVVTVAESPVAIRDLAEQIRCTLVVPFRINGNEIHSSMSVGVRVLEPGSGVEYDTILEDADSALYQAKKRGRNQVVSFDHSMRAWADEQLFLEQELNNALAFGQLSVAYQPIVRLPDGAIEGFEALARWRHPVMGDISPATFIPVAEETGMILEIGTWILNESCRQLGEWRRQGVVGQVTMSVNLSPRQLVEPDIVGEIVRTLERHDMAQGSLQLEITEGMLMSDPRAAKRILNDLRDAGVRISLDDFGTGYSSIAQLKSFPVDSAKIDRSFVSGIGYSEPSSDESLVAAIVAMSGALGFRTIAEGVENAAQSDRLFELGVRSAQGYYFAKPTAADDVPALLSGLREAQPR